MMEQICSHVCALDHGFRHSLWSAVMRSILISRDEIDTYTRTMFNLLASDEVKLVDQKDFINIEIHFQDGWKAYSTIGGCEKG